MRRERARYDYRSAAGYRGFYEFWPGIENPATSAIRAAPEDLRQLFESAIGAGASRLCLCDTVGAAVPWAVRNLVTWTRGLLEELGVAERVGIDRPTEDVAGVKLPRLVLPARPAGSMATVVELAAREHRLRQTGVNAAERLDARLRREMEES